MGETEGGKLGSGGESSGGICKSVTPDDQWRPESVAPEGEAVRPVRNPWCWSTIFSTVARIEGRIYPIPIID